MTKREYVKARALMQSHPDQAIRALLAVLVLEIDGKTFALRAAEQALATREELIAGMGERIAAQSELLAKRSEK